jgi:hypothetical protein
MRPRADRHRSEHARQAAHGAPRIRIYPNRATFRLRVRANLRAHRECADVIVAYIAGAFVIGMILFLLIHRAEV